MLAYRRMTFIKRGQPAKAFDIFFEKARGLNPHDYRVCILHNIIYVFDRSIESFPMAIAINPD